MLLFLLMLLLILIISNLSSAYTLEQQNQVCQVLNLSFTDCFYLWQNVQNIQNGTFCPVHNQTNQTIYVNQTQNITIFKEKNCSEELEFVKQADSTKIRLAEIDKGVAISPSPSIPADYISKSNCDDKCAEAVARNQATKCPVSPGFDLWDYWYLIFPAIVLLLIIWKYYGKSNFKKALYPQQFQPQTIQFPVQEVKNETSQQPSS